ncbi:MAG: DNA-binding protein, partial [Prevotella sp.]|nr:DNA-binding protein [Prevotella sp.]
MRRIKQYLLATAFAIGTAMTASAQSSYKDGFLNPTDENRSLIIWQWMDGLVTKEAITKDLEAFKAAGLSGVQNFQIGGDQQSLVGDPTCAIGSDKWKSMMRGAMEECDRLGLSFG